MFELAKTSIGLFLQGKLFADTNAVLRQLAIGVGVTVFIFLLLAKFTGLVVAGAIAGFVGGAIQPALFKDLKFR